MKDLVNNISKKKNLEVNLPKFGNEMMTVYYRYSSVRLAMNHYTYNEILSEKKDNDSNSEAGLKKLADQYFSIISDNVVKTVIGSELEEAVDNINHIRNNIISVMKGLTSLVDIFNIYEYVMNRIEYRFKDGSDVNMKDDETFTRELMQYMLVREDKAIMNARITEAIRQLPIRMTKSRFFELLKEGIRVYKDSEKTSVDDFIYMIASSSMIYTDEYAYKISEDINQIIKEFENTDFMSIDEEHYSKLREKLIYAIDYVQRTIDEYMLLAELVNDVYVILLSTPYADTDCEERNILLEILENKDSDSVEEALVRLEGKQESLYATYSKSEYLISEVLEKQKNMVESLMLSPLYNSLNVISTLESGSLFVEFDRQISHDMADEDYVINKFNDLSEQLNQFFSKHSKLINRAVMAHILSSLPVFFNNVDEIQNYVYSSISGCSDVAEKTACAEIFAMMMEEDGFNVVS